MKIWIRNVVAISFLLVSLTSHAWNALGHMVVANIAYSNLTPDVRSKVDKIAKDFSSEYASIHSFLDLAPWPDTLHSQNIESYSHWHYVDLAFSADATPLKDLTDTDNVIWAINTIEPVVKNNNANIYERARFLSFLVHMVGDIHQPLHTVSRISAAHPDGDQGGNLYKILDPKNSKTISLHQLWDRGIDLFNDDTSAEHINALTEKIMTDYPSDVLGALTTDLSAEDWANEGLALSETFVYTTPENQVPSLDYQNSGRQFSEKEIALSGYRLANILNSLLG
jgi:hypothetical protein